MTGAIAPLVLPHCVPRECCARWLARFDEINAVLPADHPDRQPTSGSLRLRALGDDWFDEILGALPAQGECLRDACWARCQHPAASRPPGQFPHSWHQDGALGSHFGEARLRKLHTLWLPLVDCGVDAPSLEWLELPPQGLLQPDELRDEALARRFGLAARRHPKLAAGDALAFGGELIHRTHVTPAMTTRRVSVELRFAVAH